MLVVEAVDLKVAEDRDIPFQHIDENALPRPEHLAERGRLLGAPGIAFCQDHSWLPHVRQANVAKRSAGGYSPKWASRRKNVRERDAPVEQGVDGEQGAFG